MDAHDAAEDKFLNEEYKIWKKNTPFLYDIVMTHSLEWPTLTVEWIKQKENTKSKDPTISTQKLVLGTHTSNDAQNYLMIADILLPCDKRKKEARTTTENAYSSVLNKIDIRQRINHDGEVHRARVMPQQNNIIATKGPTKTSYVFDINKHPATPLDNVSRPDHKLHGHTLEGYGLAWSPHQEGLLLSGADDSNICLWDIQSGGADVETHQIRRGHSTVVEDVAWNHHQPNTFGSCGDDAELFLWDLRESHQGPVQKNTTGHRNDVNCLSFNPFDEFLLATGSSDRTVALWDTRNMKQPAHVFAGHTSGVFQIQWAPFSGNVLASSGADRRLYVWDRSRIGQPQSAEDAAEGPAELLFIHGGHSSKISDFSWCGSKGQEWLVSSVSEDNILQVWQMADCIHGPITDSVPVVSVKSESDDSNSGRNKRAKH